MTFKPLKIARPGKPSGCRVSLLKNKRAAHASLLVILAGSIRDEMGLTGPATIAVLLGDEEDHGLIRIRKTTTGDHAATLTVDPSKAATGTIYYRLNLGHVDRYVDRSEPGANAKWENLGDGWFEIVLPKWADETAPKRGAVTAVDPKIAKAKQAGAADQAAQDKERRDADNRRFAREQFGDDFARKMERAAG